jgi:molybdate transport system permease protein
VTKAPVPRTLLAVAVVGLVGFFAFPLAGLLGRASWVSVFGDLGTPAVRGALALSLICSVSATALALFFGVPIAWVLARVDFPGRRWVRGAALLPLVLPPVVGGVALLFAFGRRGFAGRVLASVFGVHLPFTAGGAVLAETFVALPFLVVAVEAGFRSLDRGYEEVAASLGARPWTVFRRVTVRLAGPSLAGGIALAWARALGEFGATITFAGNVPGRTQTLPLAVYSALESDPQAALAISIVLLALSVVVLVIVGGRALPFGRPAP